MKAKAKKVMVKVGSHLIDPEDVACISRIKGRKLYVVRLKSQPNMEYPIWVEGSQIEALLSYFDIKAKDVSEEPESVREKFTMSDI